MATLLLSAAGAALGGGLGGSIGGIASGVLGKAAGAVLGSVIDQRLTGLGAETVDAGKVERFQVMGANEGQPLPRVFGRVRVAGQVIWSSRFLDDVTTRRVGGKGGGQSQKVREHSYSISLALALCEGKVARVGRIWADGQQLDLSGVSWRLHDGSEDQTPDPLIEAIEGPEEAPAYRGVAYVVFENLSLAEFGNRIPQFNFEVFRGAPEAFGDLPRPAALNIRGVALVPGTGEYALATVPIHVQRDKGSSIVANVNNDRGRPDLLVSLEQMQAELPAAKAVSLVVSWFGDDLRCGRCRLEPAVEHAQADGKQMPWRVSGIGRNAAKHVGRIDDRPAFGGTPADASVIQAIRHMTASGQKVMFYPFILMDILTGNGRPDPWTGASSQPQAPWRGRITLSVAPGQAGSPDKTAEAYAEIAAFFGSARPTDFTRTSDGVTYVGPEEWSYRRFVLHYAHLCALAGGVDAFCIGSEMRSLTQARDGVASFPAVDALCALATDVRAILGPDVKIGYAADWSEYFGHHPQDGSGDVLFHLDPLWSHPDIDFVGIDNYMPLSDWRDGSGHADEAAGSIYDLDYLKGNVAAGEGFDWHYPSEMARTRQERTPITDGAHGEPWVYRYKDLVSWWSLPHHNRIGGVREGNPTRWRPRAKPIWFTELGCPAVDKGTNQPNVFHDPKSIESFFPYFSNGGRDDLIQQRYLQASYAHWLDPAHNPVSDVYGGPMLDLDRCYVWAWDARPWPDYPNRVETWLDGANYPRGHWLNARVSLPSLGEVVTEICDRAATPRVDVSDLHGSVTGYLVSDVESGRQSLQPLMLAHAFDSFGRDGVLAFSLRHGRMGVVLSPEQLVATEGEATLELTRAAALEATGRVILSYVRGDADYQTGAAESVAADVVESDASRSSVALTLSDDEARGVADRWLSEARVALSTAQFQLPLSMLGVTAGDVIGLSSSKGVESYRVDRVEEFSRRVVTAVRVEPGLYRAPIRAATLGRSRFFVAPSPAHVEFLDLPLLSGDEVPHAPHVAATKSPWTGSMAVYSAPNDFGYSLNREILRPATIGETMNPLPTAEAGLWSRARLKVRLTSGLLQSVEEADVLNGANVAAVRVGGEGDWEVMQFATARLVARGEYELGALLRGQAGTDGVILGELPAGADFVLLDSAVVQIEHGLSARGLLRHYRTGPLTRAYDDESFEHVALSFEGVGLRPYRPAQLKATMASNGDVTISWMRRTRVDGDNWSGREVPLGEEKEFYHVRVMDGSRVVREFYPNLNHQIYSADEKSSDGTEIGFGVEVAQLSDRFGSGPYARLNFLADE